MDDELPKLDRVKFREQVLAAVERVVQEVADAVDEAPAGQVIRDSEEKSRDSLDRFRQIVYEQALQNKVDAAAAAFPPSDQFGDRPPQTP